MEQHISGRDSEKQILENLLHSSQAELVALYGRRRVGKTYLIKTFYREHLAFSCSGQYNGKTKEQLINFSEQLAIFFPDKKIRLAAESWQNAFQQLQECMAGLRHTRKKVLFFDELPWLDNRKSGFLSSFSYFWNNFASQRNDLIVIICGSAALWIIEKVLNNKGGLHNRVTQRIRLLPFTLKETETYLHYRGIRPDRYQLIQLYMAMGGIPQYLNQVERGLSAAQNIQKICFSKDGALNSEFNNLYAALFNNPEKHINIIKALANKNQGLTRNELLKTGRLFTGGSITLMLEELTESGFIEKIYPFENQEKNALYRLTDEYSHFYLRFMQHGGNSWLSQSTGRSYNGWCGYAFENICFRHIHQLKISLQVAGIHSSVYSWYKAANEVEDGAQIDLLIDRADHCINVCEMKFSTAPFNMDKKYAVALRKKLEVFREQTGTKNTLVVTMITTYGTKTNLHREQLIDHELTMDALFAS